MDTNASALDVSDAWSPSYVHSADDDFGDSQALLRVISFALLMYNNVPKKVLNVLRMANSGKLMCLILLKIYYFYQVMHEPMRNAEEQLESCVQLYLCHSLLS